MLTCISPHSDDAALSCGGLLAMEAAQGRPGLVVTVMAGPAPPAQELTPLARAVHGEWGDPADPMAQRRREDACALEALRCAGIWWDYLDAIYRHPAYDSRERLFGAPAAEEPLEEELRARCAALPGGLLLFPLAVGQHVDHQLLCRVGWGLALAGRPVAFYEDLPYAAWEEGPAARLAALGRPLTPHAVDVTSHWPAKLAAVRCYASQYVALAHEGVSLEQALDRYARSIVPGACAERLWYPGLC